MGSRTKWNCFYCGDEVIEGQRFTFIPGKGAVHIECLNEIILRAPSRDVIAVSDANEALLYTIIRLKEAERIAGTSNVKEEIARIRREVERLAGNIVKLLPSV